MLQKTGESQRVRHLTVSHRPVVVSVGQQHMVQNCLHARLCFALEEDVVRKGSVHVCQKRQEFCYGMDLMCVTG